jgi:NAD(P)-dependent dehydrogenase (short-subunit alcohol dehydrogenase family)
MKMSDKPISLSGRVAVVTGSTRGIGRAIVEKFGQAGARVVVSSSNPDAVQCASSELCAQGIQCIGVPCDVSDRAQVKTLLDCALAEWGAVDIWVNNAGVSGPFGYALDVPPEAWERVLHTNLFGSYYGCMTVLPHMLERRYGKIINLSGGGARRAQRCLNAYSASKAAIVRMSEGLARDYKDHRFLSINVLEPGMVKTDMLTSFEAIGPAADALKALPRVMRIFSTTLEECAQLALRLASSASDGVSGKVFSLLPRRRVIWRLAQATLQRR